MVEHRRLRPAPRQLIGRPPSPVVGNQKSALAQPRQHARDVDRMVDHQLLQPSIRHRAFDHGAPHTVLKLVTPLVLKICTALALSWSLPAKPSSRQTTRSGRLPAMVRITSSVSSRSRQMNSAPPATAYTILPAIGTASTGVVSEKPLLRRIS